MGSAAAKLVDYSMLTSEELQRLSTEPIDELCRNSEDLTDLQNDEFIVSRFYKQLLPY